MPELPEVETIRIGLATLITGKQILHVASNNQKSFPNSQPDIDQFLLNSSVLNVRRRGKVLIIELSSQYSLIIHLKMTGQLVFSGDGVHFGAGHPNASLVGNLPDSSTRAVLTFEDRSKLFFNDQRKFGWMRLVPTIEIENIDFFKKMGPELLSKQFGPTDFKSRLMRRPRSSIKAVLLDQTIVAGIGNIYADESLWGAKIHPQTLVQDLSPVNIKHLYSSIIEVLSLSINKGGSTDKNYIDAEGRKGSYLSFAKVFRREGLACPRCGTLIRKIRVAGRGTHVCENCQKLN